MKCIISVLWIAVMGACGVMATNAVVPKEQIDKRTSQLKLSMFKREA